MSANYDFFRTPQPKDKDKEIYHARLVVKESITTEKLVETIANRCSLQKGDVLSALVGLADLLQEKLSDGCSVHLDGVGSFRIKAESPAVCSVNEIRAESICCGGVVYTPEKKLLRELAGTKFERVRFPRRSKELTDIEIDGMLADYFQEHDCITTRELVQLCGLRPGTALRRLQERVEQGRLTHPGYRRAPFYFPVPGSFRVDRVSEESESVL